MEKAVKIDMDNEDKKSLLGCFNKIGTIIAVMSGKGGVGKSTVSSLLAVEIKRNGFTVGVLDADITGPSIPRAFGLGGVQPLSSPYGIEPPLTSSGIKVVSINMFLPNEDDPVVWRGPLLAGAAKQFYEETNWADLDYLIVDLPPGTGDVPLTVLQSMPVTGIVIVTSPQDMVSMVVKKSVKMAKAIGTSIIGVVENMNSAICPCCGEKLALFGQATSGETEELMGVPFLGGIPWDVNMTQAMDNGKLEEYRFKEFEPVVKKVMERLSDDYFKKGNIIKGI